MIVVNGLRVALGTGYLWRDRKLAMWEFPGFLKWLLTYLIVDIELGWDVKQRTAIRQSQF